MRRSAAVRPDGACSSECAGEAEAVRSERAWRQLATAESGSARIAAIGAPRNFDTPIGSFVTQPSTDHVDSVDQADLFHLELS
jgi:hypothetical protein